MVRNRGGWPWPVVKASVQVVQPRSKARCKRRSGLLASGWRLVVMSRLLEKGGRHLDARYRLPACHSFEPLSWASELRENPPRGRFFSQNFLTTFRPRTRFPHLLAASGWFGWRPYPANRGGTKPLFGVGRSHIAVTTGCHSTSERRPRNLSVPPDVPSCPRARPPRVTAQTRHPRGNRDPRRTVQRSMARIKAVAAADMVGS